MKIFYHNETLPTAFTKTIFLAGPINYYPRTSACPSWRIEALDVFEGLWGADPDAAVLLPEHRGDNWNPKIAFEAFTENVLWEYMAMEMSDVILFWMPRTGDRQMPCTDLEWGRWAPSGKCILGYPLEAKKMVYHKNEACKFNVPVFHTIAEAVTHAAQVVDKMGPVLRSGGERFIPLHLWHDRSLQAWLGSRGEPFERARVSFTHAPSPSQGDKHLWSLVLTSPGRPETVVVGLPPSTTVVLYRSDHVVLVEKHGIHGSVHLECPSGASPHPLVVEGGAAHATGIVHSSTGLDVPTSRFKHHGERFSNSSHTAQVVSVFSAELTEAEMRLVRAGKGEGARKARVIALEDLICPPSPSAALDWGQLGFVLLALKCD